MAWLVGGSTPAGSVRGGAAAEGTGRGLEGTGVCPSLTRTHSCHRGIEERPQAMAGSSQAAAVAFVHGERLQGVRGGEVGGGKRGEAHGEHEDELGEA